MGGANVKGAPAKWVILPIFLGVDEQANGRWHFESRNMLWLVVWNIFHFFHSVGNVIIPIDEL